MKFQALLSLRKRKYMSSAAVVIGTLKVKYILSCFSCQEEYRGKWCEELNIEIIVPSKCSRLSLSQTLTTQTTPSAKETIWHDMLHKVTNSLSAEYAQRVLYPLYIGRVQFQF